MAGRGRVEAIMTVELFQSAETYKNELHLCIKSRLGHWIGIGTIDFTGLQHGVFSGLNTIEPDEMTELMMEAGKAVAAVIDGKIETVRRMQAETEAGRRRQG
jgi:hypothetical protein